MLPADQRFHTSDGAAGEIEFRLVEQHQFVLIDGAAQLAEQCDVILAVLRQLRVVNRIATLATLGRIHRHVGVPQQHVGILTVLRKVNDADAGADVNRLLLDNDGRLHRCQYFACNDFGATVLARWHQDREFITAQPRNGVRLAQQSTQATSHFAKHHVADRMAECVVDIFETIQIEQHHA